MPAPYSRTLTRIAPDGTTTTHEPAGKDWTLKELQAHVDGYIEPIWGDDTVALVDGTPLGCRPPGHTHFWRIPEVDGEEMPLWC